MSLKCGIVGLPNVGKSTLFNCLSNAKAQSANFPFCTIEPNVGMITVPDERLSKLEELVKLQSEAIKNIRIDKVTVWDSNGGKEGGSSTANFLSGMYKSVPPLQDIFKLAGMELPDYLGEKEDDDEEEEKDEKPKGHLPPHKGNNE